MIDQILTKFKRKQFVNLKYPAKKKVKKNFAFDHDLKLKV